MSETFYELLDVDADASQSVIRDAYREKVKEYHPDVSDHPEATERFKRVKRAEEVLCDPDERATYDRLGHDAYVGDATADANASNTSSSDSKATTVEDVRRAAARTAGRSRDDAGGRSAGWRERERQSARRRATDWFGGDASESEHDRGWASRTNDGRGFGARKGGTERQRRSTDDGAADEQRTANGNEQVTDGDERTTGGGGRTTGGDGLGDAWWEDLAGDAAGPSSKHWPGDVADFGGHGARRGTDDETSGAADHTATASADRGPTDARSTAATDAAEAAAAGSRHAATEAWGHRVDRKHEHAVHEWSTDDSNRLVLRPDWTQDDVVVLVATLFLYPILLALTVFPSFPLAVNLAAGGAILAYVAVLLPRPAMALPIFGVWSVGVPAGLLWFGVPLTSTAAIVTLAAVWTPMLFAVAVASVLVR